MQAPTKTHFEAMKQVMAFCISTWERGRVIVPDSRWDGKKEFEFKVSGKSDSTYNQCPETRKCASGSTMGCQSLRSPSCKKQ
jgi:hypothetical protein